jgi:Carboxypeptidase regulatory-like domain
MRFLVLAAAFLFAAPHGGSAQEIARTYRIGGAVIDAKTGAPVPHARVFVSAEANGADATADDEGHFVFEGLPPGKYMLSARAQGYVPASYDQHGQFSTGIAVGPGLDSENIVFRLPPQAVIYGTITDEHGDAVRDAQVTVFEAQPAGQNRRPLARGQVSTNDLGQYRFAHLRAGSYYVAVEARPWYAEAGFKYPAESSQQDSFVHTPLEPPSSNPLLDVVYPLTFYPGVTDAAAANELRLQAGGEEEADVEMIAVPSVHILVTGLPPSGPSDQPFRPEITVSASAFGGSLTTRGPAPEREVAPGEWEVAGLPPDGATLAIRQFRSGGESSRTIVTGFAEGDTVDAARAAPPASMSGHVAFTKAPGLSQETRVLLTNESDRQTLFAQLRKDGSFSLPFLDAGTYRVNVWMSGPRQQQYIESVSATGARVTGHEITVPASANVRLSLIIGRGLAALKGVAKLDGTPKAGVMVLLVPASGDDTADNSRRDQSDSDGTFTLRNVIPGKYILMAIANGWDLDWTNPAALKPYRDKGEPIEIASGGNQDVSVDVQHLSK